MKRENRFKLKRFDLFDCLNAILMVMICLSVFYPIWYVLVNSLNESSDAVRGPVFWFPRVFSLEAYEAVFTSSGILTSFGVTVARTLLASSLHVFFTAMVAYALTKKYLIARKFYILIGTVTLFFSGGLIPYFILIRNLGLYDNFLVYIFPAMFSFFNLLIFQAFFRQLPVEMEESAKIDGANDLFIFVRIIIPLSAPVIATIALFVGVGNWNDYFTGVIFIGRNQHLLPVQTFLYKIIAETSSNQIANNMPVGASLRRVSSTSIKLAMMIITTLPIVMTYPFLQKYFVKGLLLGAIKG